MTPCWNVVADLTGQNMNEDQKQEMVQLLGMNNNAIKAKHGYNGSNGASHFGGLVPAITVQMVPIISVLFMPLELLVSVQTMPL